jgi:hypothetical protein
MRLHDTHPPQDADLAAEAERSADEVLADLAQARQDADTPDDATAAAAWERVAHASLMLAAQAARLVELLAADPQRCAA